MRRSRVWCVLFLVLAVPSTAPVWSEAPHVVFVQIPAVPGESIDEVHTDWIDAISLYHSFDHGCAPGGACGTPTFGRVSFLKWPDKATPLLQLATATGTVYPEAVIEVCRPNPAAPRVPSTSATTRSGWRR